MLLNWLAPARAATAAAVLLLLLLLLLLLVVVHSAAKVRVASMVRRLGAPAPTGRAAVGPRRHGTGAVTTAARLGRRRWKCRDRQCGRQRL